MAKSRWILGCCNSGLVGSLLVVSVLGIGCSKSDQASESTRNKQEPKATVAPIASAASPPPPPAEAAGSDPTGFGIIGTGKGGGGMAKASNLGKDPGSMYDRSKPTIAGPRPAKKIDAGSTSQAEAAINPNGRFATTYRPGGGHLSAFEAAVARGIIPEGERELVSDVGARYVSESPKPTKTTIAINTELERAKLPPTGGAFHTRLTLNSIDKAPAARPHLSVHLVLDVSGSMGGDSISNARKAAQALVDKLGAGDDFSLVTFSTEAQVVIADGPVGTRREQIKNTIAGITAAGGTNIGAGLTMGYQQAKSKGIPDDAVKVVLLLSDGHVNAGILGKESLAKLALDAFQDGIQTSAFGLGTDYDGPLMSAIAADGAGGYYYLRDSEQIAPALTTELDKRLDPVATAVEVRIRLKKGVELLHVYGSRRLNEAEAARVRIQEVAMDAQEQKHNKIKKDRQDDLDGGMRFFIPAFARNDSHALLFKYRVPEGVGSKPIAMVELKYKDRISKKNVSDEFAVNIEYAKSDADSFASRNASVSRTVQGFAAGEALANASSLINQGDRAQAASLLIERAGILREAAASLGEPLFLKDAERLERLRNYTQTQSGLGDPLVLAMLLETASNVHLR